MDCALVIRGKEINVKITDFSVGGIGLIIKDTSILSPEPFDLKLDNLDINTKARIAWIEEMFSGSRVGIQKIGPLHATLQNYRLSDILLGLQRLGKTGTLKIHAESALRKIYLNEGDVIFSASDQEKERMGDILLDVGKISREAYKKSVEIMKSTGKRQGAALVEIGSLSPSELIWAVRYQVESIILNAFNLEKGTVIFKDEPLPIDEVVILKLSTADLIYRGVKGIDDLEKLKTICPPLDSVLYFSAEPIRLFQKVTLKDHEKKIISLIDGNKTIEDIIAQSPMDQRETLKTIYALCHTQIIEVIDKGIIVPTINKEEVLEPAKPEEDSVLVDKIEKLYEEHKKLDYYGILDISRGASPDEIKRAYHRMAKEYHPDRHLNFQSETLKHKLNTLFAYINEAYNSLAGQMAAQQATVSQPETMSDDEDKQKAAMLKFDEGKKCFLKEDYDQALTFLGQAVYLDDSQPEYHYYYGVALMHNKKLKDAEQSVKKAIELDPYNADYVAELGHIYLTLGFKTRAKNSFEKALKYDPSNYSAQEGLKGIAL